MATTWQIGDRIQNRFEVYNVLQGGMGEVYVVYDHHTSLPLALKTFRSDLFEANDTIADRFAREALVWINLDVHPNVVTATYLDNLEGKQLLFLEYVGGGDLSSWIGTPRLLENLPQVLRFGIQFCDGMVYAMSKGIKVHRDIKSQNCLIAQDNTLKVSDFGLAKIFSDVGAEPNAPTGQPRVGIELSRTGAIAGTLTHMAPEQFQDARGVDVRADIYSFGVMLFEMATGRVPFLGHSFEEFRYLHESQRPQRLPPAAAPLNSIIETCLAKRPADRFADFGQLRKRLAELYERCVGEPAPTPAAGAELSASRLATKSWSLCNLGQPEEALACAEQALKVSPDLELVWNTKGISLEALGQLTEALECYDHAIELNPRSVQGWANKALILIESGRLEEGTACCDRVIEIDPHAEAGWNNKGKCLINMGRHAEALACLDRALKLNPRSDIALCNKGTVLAKMGAFDESIKYYTSALRINPRMGAAWTNSAAPLTELGRYDEALACLDRAFKLHGRLEEVWISKGRALHGLGRTEEALDCYERALGLNPRSDMAWVNKGLVLVQMGRHAEALDCADRALALNLRTGGAWFMKGITLSVMGATEDSLACLDREIELNPTRPTAWYVKGEGLAKLERYEEAAGCLERTVELNPGNADAWVLRGDVLSELGRNSEAIDCYRRALEIDPGQSGSWFGLGMILVGASRFDAAIECFKEAQSLGHPGSAAGIEGCRRILGE